MMGIVDAIVRMSLGNCSVRQWKKNTSVALTKKADDIEIYEHMKNDQFRFCNEFIFYNSYHFYYRGLIEKGLSLEAPNNMYK